MTLDDEEEEEDLVKLIPMNNMERGSRTLPRASAMISDLVQKALENQPDVTELHLPSVACTELKLIVEYMEHHEGTEKSQLELPFAHTTGTTREDFKKIGLSYDWDYEFITQFQDQSQRQTLYNLIAAVEYMGIPGLNTLLSAVIGLGLRACAGDHDKLSTWMNVGTDNEQQGLAMTARHNPTRLLLPTDTNE